MIVFPCNGESGFLISIRLPHYLYYRPAQTAGTFLDDFADPQHGYVEVDAGGMTMVPFHQQWRDEQITTGYRMGPPSYVSYFIKPMNTIVISTINHG